MQKNQHKAPGLCINVKAYKLSLKNEKCVAVLQSVISLEAYHMYLRESLIPLGFHWALKQKVPEMV